MEECQEGKKEGLLQLVKILEYQKCCELGLKNGVIHDYLVLRKSELRRYCEGIVEKPHSIVMENCDCYSLSQFLEHKDYLTEEQVREIAYGCVLGLNYLHERGIVHGVS